MSGKRPKFPSESVIGDLCLALTIASANMLIVLGVAIAFSII